jgi:hypothetical protein
MARDALAAAALAHKGEILAPVDVEGYVLHQRERTLPVDRDPEVLNSANPAVGCVHRHGKHILLRNSI